MSRERLRLKKRVLAGEIFLIQNRVKIKELKKLLRENRMARIEILIHLVKIKCIIPFVHIGFKDGISPVREREIENEINLINSRGPNQFINNEDEIKRLEKLIN